METGEGSSAPAIMVFRPTMEEFKDFSGYIKKMESCGAHKAGIAKIIPPEEWCPRKEGYDDVDLIIPTPISQVVSGSHGLFQQSSIERQSMSVKEFRKLAESSKYQTPPHSDYNDLERKYWKYITLNPPIYGADVSGSIYDDGVEEFNIQHLNTILDLVNNDYGIKIEGVNTAYLYFGMWKTTFAWHIEDMDLYSINYVHFGAPKSWYAIPPEHGRRFERLAEGFFQESFQICPAFLRHKMTIISPKILKKYSIPCNKITQEPGEFIITFPFGYHSGFNHGFNCAESTNFALPRWVEYGKRAFLCTCRTDSVKIFMGTFIRKFQPDRYELWKEGKDVGPHPEDPNKHYAATPPSKTELAIAASRNKRDTEKKKRLKHKKIHSTKNSDGEDTEMCYVKGTLKRPKKENKKSRLPSRNEAAPFRVKTTNKTRMTLEQVMLKLWDPNLVRPKQKLEQTEFGFKLTVVNPRRVPIKSYSGSTDEEDPELSEAAQSALLAVLNHSDDCASCDTSSSESDTKASLGLSSSNSVAIKKRGRKRKSDSENNAVENKKGRKKKMNTAQNILCPTSERKSKEEHSKDMKETRVSWVYPVSDILQHNELNVESEREYNIHMSSVEPHCAVCTIFCTPSNQSGMSSEDLTLPPSSKVKMQPFCFTKSIDYHCNADPNPLLERDGTSPLLVCTSCRVCVHATCYGITLLKSEPWLCAKCAIQAEDAKCCLCVLRGGALKPTTDGRWAHIVCAAFIDETHFENVILREPINVSQVTSKRMSFKCIYCINSQLSTSDNGSCCVQCHSEKCYTSFHVTCGHLAQASFECGDWPNLISISCPEHLSRKRKPDKRQPTDVNIGDAVLAKSGNRRYYWTQVKNKYSQVYCSVLFSDNSTSTNLLPEDIVDEHGVQRALPEIDEKILVKWTDGETYDGIFKGSRTANVYVVEFDDGSVTDLERHEFYADDEKLPAKVQSKISLHPEENVDSCPLIEPDS